jgi:hypothetical protein
VGDQSDVDKLRDTMPSDEDTDTFYRPDLSKAIPPTSDATLGLSKATDEPDSRLVSIMRFFVPRRRRPHRNGTGLV